MAHSGSPTWDASIASDVAAGSGAPAPRAARFAATGSDLLRLAAGSVATALVAIAFLFWRTSWGAIDASAADTAVAAALLLAPAPTWIAWMLIAVIDDRATPGQLRRGLYVREAASAWPAARLIRFAVHPLSAPGWLWIAAIAFLLEARWMSWIAVLVAAAVTLVGAGSFVLVAVGRRSFHDLLARTAVEVRR